MASAGPYASLHLAPDRQPRQHPTTQFLQAGCPSNSVKALKARYRIVQRKMRSELYVTVGRPSVCLFDTAEAAGVWFAAECESGQQISIDNCCRRPCSAANWLPSEIITAILITIVLLLLQSNNSPRKPTSTSEATESGERKLLTS